MQQGSLIQERSEARNLARKVRRASCSQAWQEAPAAAPVASAARLPEHSSVD